MIPVTNASTGDVYVTTLDWDTYRHNSIVPRPRGRKEKQPTELEPGNKATDITNYVIGI